MKFSVAAIICLATLSDVFAQTGTKSTKSDGKSTKTAKSSKVTSAPVNPSPVSSAPVTSAPVTSAPVSSAPVTSAPTQCPSGLPCDGTLGPLRCTNNGFDSCVNGCCVRNPTSAPVTSAPVTSAPITSSPTSAALAYSPVGPGDSECIDGNGNDYSSFGLFLGPVTAAECSAKCSVDFDHPHLVGFGMSTTAGEKSCFCYYSGGVTPSLPVPNGFAYNQYLHAGNGPIMSTRPRQGFNCFGTGSPITSGATKAPITPSPTGVVTPAPTPVGISTYSFLGAGICEDSSGDFIDYVAATIGTVTAPECSKFCGQFASSDLLGFTLDKLGGTLNCLCHFSDGKIPNLPSGSGWSQLRSDFVGSGPITQANPPNDPNNDCYVYPQGSASPVASPP
eukprot:scaffold50742_cov44-Cyclotella_meneghiniana.AAC.1